MHLRIAHRHDRHRFILIHPFRIRPAKYFACQLHLSARLFDCDAILEAGGRGKVVALIVAIGVGLQWNPDFSIGSWYKRWRHDADYRIRLAIERDGAV